MSRSITDLLNELGSTPDAIAASLRERGVVGKPGWCRQCPLAVYLRKQGIRDAAVTDIIAHGHESRKRNRISVRLPEAARQFVFRMDRGYYPDLEATNTEE